MPGAALHPDAFAETERPQAAHDDLVTTLPSARDVAPTETPAATDASVESAATLPTAPWKLVVTRRSYAVAHASRKLIANHPWLAVGVAAGVGILVGRALSPTGRNKLGMRLLTLVARRAGRIVLEVAEASFLGRP